MRHTPAPSRKPTGGCTRKSPKRARPLKRGILLTFYTIDKTILDQQIRDQIIKIKNGESPELNAAFDAITKQLLEKGLEWE